ncbi:MAG: septum site-determining protein MinD [Butyricicoccus sp.]|nr:septum site-determining protein MinD [Butyricicoccus sp.]
MFKVILVASGKGGTGKTSLTANVASAMAERGHRVLVIDADSGLRNLDIVLGLSDSIVFSFADVAQGIAPLERAAVPHSIFPSLSLLTAPGKLPPLTREQLEHLMQQAEQLGFEYVLIDGPAGLAPEIRLFAQVATQGLVVTMPDQASVRGAERVARLLESENIIRIRMVVNRVRPSLIKHGVMGNIDDTMDLVGLPLLGIVPEDEDVIACGSSGKCLLQKKRGGAATAFRNIAQRLDGIRLPIMRI